jgi:DNA repair protein RecO (recombination protein O)
MEWRDEGVIIGVKHHGETSVIAEVLTKAHGRHLGLVRSGRSKNMRSLMQAGNQVACQWRARLEDHLGLYALEATHLRAAEIMHSAFALHALNVICGLARLLPERDPHPAIYESVHILLAHIDEPIIAAALIVRLELALLSELGFGLDLSSCAATGVSDDLIYVSPKSGRAVSRVAGQPWHDKLLGLPAFMRGEIEGISADEIIAGFALTGYFLERDVYAPRGQSMPDARRALVTSLTQRTSIAP